MYVGIQNQVSYFLDSVYWIKYCEGQKLQNQWAAQNNKKIPTFCKLEFLSLGKKNTDGVTKLIQSLYYKHSNPALILNWVGILDRYQVGDFKDVVWSSQNTLYELYYLVQSFQSSKIFEKTFQISTAIIWLLNQLIKWVQSYFEKVNFLLGNQVFILS